MKKKGKAIALRLDSITYEKIKYFADKYDRSINSEINILLGWCVSKWKREVVNITVPPKELQNIQDDSLNMTDDEFKTYLEAIQQNNTENNPVIEAINKKYKIKI